MTSSDGDKPDVTSDPRPQSRLISPTGWLVDDLARIRLSRVLSRAPREIAGVVAPATPDPPPGASFRTHAERRALLPISEVEETRSRSIAGSVLLRAEFDATPGRDSVELSDVLPLLVDPGTHAFDPWQQVESLEAASAEGRSPFPRRPLVLLLGLDDDVDLSDWARSMVNELIRRDVEARLAIPNVTPGLQLSRPCLPCAETVQALRPDVLVALDEPTKRVCDEWLTGDRSAIVVHMTDAIAKPLRYVSWRIGEAQGRVRARIGRRISAEDLASAINRLCSGPQPLPPTDADVDAFVASTRSEAGVPPRSRSVVALSGSDDPGRARLDAILDHIAANGHFVDHHTLGARVPEAVKSADLVIVRSFDRADRLSQLAAVRRHWGRITVFDVSTADLVDDGASGAAFGLKGPALEFAKACRHVITPSRTLHATMREHRLRSLVVPTPLARRDINASRVAAREGASRIDRPVVGWIVGAHAPPEQVGATAEALDRLAAGRPDVTIEMVGAESAAGFLSGPTAERARVVAPDRKWGMLDPGVLARWSVAAWNPSPRHVEASGDTLMFTQSALAGIPVAVASSNPASDDALADWVVEREGEVDAWLKPLDAALAGADELAIAKDAAARRAEALTGARISASVAARMLGWALFEVAR